MENRLRSNIISMFILQGSNYVLPLAVVPYLVRVLGPGHFGQMAFAQAFVSYFAIFTDYGFGWSATRQIAARRDDPEFASRLLSTVTFIKISFMVTGFFIMFASTIFVPSFRADRLLFCLAYIGILGSVMTPGWLYQGLERLKITSNISILSRLIVTVMIFIFVRRQGDFLLAVFLQACGGLISGVLLLSILPRIMKFRLSAPRLADIRESLFDGWHYFISTAAISLYTSSNIFVLGLMSSPLEVGYFAAAQKLMTAAQGLVGPVSTAVYPYIAGQMAQSKARAIQSIRKVLFFQGLGTLGISLCLLVFGGLAVRILLGAKFLPSIFLIQIMSPMPFMIGLSNIFGIQTMLNFGMKKQFSRILISSGMVNIVLLVMLTGGLGARGAAISVTITELGVTLAMAAVIAVHLETRDILRPVAPAELGDFHFWKALFSAR